MRASLGVVAAALVVGAPGCSYPSYAFSDPLDGAAPPADDARDASRPPDDTGDDVAALDAAASDAPRRDSSAADSAAIDSAPLDAADGAVLDSRVDDTARADTRAPGCGPSVALFCEDFDSVSTPDTGWSGNFVVGGGKIALDASGLSPPSALLSALSDSPSTESAATVYYLTPAPTPSSLARIDLDVLLDVGTYPTSVVLFKLQRPGKGRGVSLGLGPTGLAVEVLGATSTINLDAGPAPVGRWFHVRLDTQLMVAGATVRLWIDDMTTPVVDRSGLSSADTDGTSQQFNVGLYTNSPPISAVRARFDDAELDYP